MTRITLSFLLSMLRDSQFQGKNVITLTLELKALAVFSSSFTNKGSATLRWSFCIKHWHMFINNQTLSTRYFCITHWHMYIKTCIKHWHMYINNQTLSTRYFCITHWHMYRNNQTLNTHVLKLKRELDCQELR